MALMMSLLWRPGCVHENALFSIWIVIQEGDLSDFLYDNNISVSEIECRSNESATTKSFRIKVDLFDADNVMKLEI